MINYDFLYDKTFYNELITESYFDSKKLSYVCYNNALVLPYRLLKLGYGGGVVTCSGEYLENTAIHNKSGNAYDVKQDEIVLSNEKAIYIGMFQKIWGHCITDNIRRLWFLKLEEYKQKYLDYKIIYIPIIDFEFSNSFTELLHILGIDRKQLISINKPTRFSKIIIPDESFYTCDGNKRYFTIEYTKTIDIIRNYALQHISPLKNEKIYFTYSHLNKGTHIGEERLEHFFREQGYEIVAPEEYSFYEQLNMLVQCKYFASTIGSCSHNIVFLGDGASAYLIPRGNYLTGYQLALNEVHNINITYVDANLSVSVNRDYPWCGPFYYFISKELLDCFGCSYVLSKQYFIENFKDFEQYLEMGDSSLLWDHSCISDPNYHQADYYINEYLQVMNLSRTSYEKKIKIKSVLKKIKSKIKK